jgi:uncharacterized protein (TIGR02145 family)
LPQAKLKWSFYLPAGNRNNGGGFNNLGSNGYFWSATENSATNAWYRNLNTGNWQSNRNNTNKTNGFSVRCLQQPSLRGARTRRRRRHAAGRWPR